MLEMLTFGMVGVLFAAFVVDKAGAVVVFVKEKLAKVQ